MEVLFMVTVALAAIIAVILASANNRIRAGCWLIASGRAMHEYRAARRAISEEAALYQQALEKEFGVREPRVISIPTMNAEQQSGVKPISKARPA
jgi:hypothetical protein